MNDFEKTRDEIVDVLRKDVFGPYFGDEEELEEIPILRYSAGVLYPQGEIPEDEVDDGGPGQDSETVGDDSEPGLALSNVMYPSCYGITFTCRKGTDLIGLEFSCGVYEAIDSSVPNDPNEAPQSQTAANSTETGSKKTWKRKALCWSGTVSVREPSSRPYEVAPELFIIPRIRLADSFGDVTVTVSVVNRNKVKSLHDLTAKTIKSFFQVNLRATGLNGYRPFVDRKGLSPGDSEEELQAIRLIYRHVSAFATGHGCAANWEDTEEPDASFVETAFVPLHTVYPMRPPTDQELPEFSILRIAEGSPGSIKSLFQPIHEKYIAWIEELEKISVSLDAQYRQAAKDNLGKCRQTARRIRRGIELLTRDPQVFRAFQLAHKAMLHQFARSAWIREGRCTDTGPVCDSSHKWRPFQIAFILQCLESVAYRNSSERDLVDLLWFPTGGGKTEAYLGLIAFMIFLRRLRKEGANGRGAGTVALMRYTLRLLTVDQFYRASLLVCSCEKVRREEADLDNTEPVSIGLWVGGEASPNRLNEARRILRQIQAGSDNVEGGSPVKLQECPWCGKTMGPADYFIPNDLSEMQISCPNRQCDFHDRLHVWVVDEDVYRVRPSLIIGTVDKFARIPWVEESGNIFGTDGRTTPPELVVQDELHLISGPLGTLVGLYETAIDLLCRDNNGHGPKVIASTATIRNASSQVKSLFCKDVRQFPPSGLDYRDSFFAREDRDLPGRLYAGIFTPGTSPTTALVRTFGSLLHGAQASSANDGVRDPYWTLMAYFNSLRELGGARTQVEDDVVDYLKFCAKRDGDAQNFRPVENVSELTSRVDSTELEEVRRHLWETITDGDPLDVVLATNMISVGLDVPRLGLMSVVGQPKSTSEYIQASSRIGRRYPGLVVTIYNWTRSRDRSHYERFKSYHGRLYSEVEATSVTPFSSRSRDRGLHAVLIILIRHLVNGMRTNSSAINFHPSDPQVQQYIDCILERVENIDALEREDTSKAIREIVRRWSDLCELESLPYVDWNEGVALMKPAEDRANQRSFPTLNSLRNIDPAANIFLCH